MSQLLLLGGSRGVVPFWAARLVAASLSPAHTSASAGLSSSATECIDNQLPQSRSGARASTSSPEPRETHGSASLHSPSPRWLRATHAPPCQEPAFSSSSSSSCGGLLPHRTGGAFLPAGQPGSPISLLCRPPGDLPWQHPSAAGPPSLHHLSPAAGLLHQRGYKSNKRSMKPLNTTASWAAARPFLPRSLLPRQRVPPPGSAASPAPHSPASAQHPLALALPKPLSPAAPRAARSLRSTPSRYTRKLRAAPFVDTCLPPVPQVPLPPEWRLVAHLTGERYSLQLVPAFAVVQLCGTQFKLTVDDVLFVNRMHGTRINDVLALDRVMLVGTKTNTTIGRPYVPNAVVLVAVEEHFRDGKVHVFKKKRRKRHSRYHGSRAELTTLRVVAVLGDAAAATSALLHAGGGRRGAVLATPGGDVDEWAALQKLRLPVKLPQEVALAAGAADRLLLGDASGSALPLSGGAGA